MDHVVGPDSMACRGGTMSHSSVRAQIPSQGRIGSWTQEGAVCSCRDMLSDHVRNLD